MQITPEQMLEALDQFRGDIDVYPDGSVQLRPYHPDYETVGGSCWSLALVRLVKDQLRAARKRNAPIAQ